MPNQHFQFKQFTIHQDRCAFKVGTDGCLLGAWTPIEGANRILDIGSGTGMIALMLAQRTEHSEIIAIEPDPASAAQANENISQGPWDNRMKLQQATLQQFTASEPMRFDLIVSNPPFFTGSTLNEDPRSTNARHESTLSLQTLLHLSSQLLSPGGRFSIILPIERREDFLSISKATGWNEQRLAYLSPLPTKPVHRFMSCLSLEPGELLEEQWSIYQEHNSYSEIATRLLHPFYLYL